MASLFESQIADLIYKGFKGKLLTGTLRRETSSSLDSYGDPASPTVTSYDFEGIREDFDAAYAARAGIPITDVKILIIAGSIEVQPTKDDKVFIRNRWHQVRRIISIDPASATYTLQAFEVEAPA